MTPITVSLELPRQIAAGLLAGAFERVGGVIRTTDTKQVVLWLRETSPTTVGSLTSIPPVLARLGSVASIISLGISVATFGMLSERLNQIDARLKEVQKALNQIGRQLNVLCDAQIYAAFSLAHSALNLSSAPNRHAVALMAIDRLMVAQRQLAALADEQLQQATQTADEYLLLLMLAHLYEVRCFLELEELEHALSRLRAGMEVVRLRVERYVNQLLTNNPAVYLQPALAHEISLERFSHIYRWISSDKTLDPVAIFEELRSQIFALQPNSNTWIQTLPTSIWDPALSPSSVTAPSGVSTAIWALFGWDSTTTEQRDYVLKRLVQAVSNMETMIETYQRFAGYQDEIQSIHDLGLTFQQWSRLLPETPQLEASVVYIQRTETTPLRV